MIDNHSYRADIDGLRAIAVLLVVAFHALPQSVSGGFVGVDVFFVISGFLISRIIVDDLAADRFSLLGFYGRRARRIFPALALVVSVTLLAGVFGLFPVELESLGKHALASALFVQNLVLFDEVNYFDTVADLKPLLHVWSLAVEEQFYLLWPFLMLAAWRMKLPPVALALLVLVASFACNMVLVKTSPVAAFFLPVTRFWELMAGALLAISPSVMQTLSATSMRAEATGASGAALLVVSPLVITSGAGFPGTWALLPVGGTFLLIAAGPSHFIARHLLRRRLLVQIGLISYPLYLWHWPILSFARNLHLKEPTALMKLAYVALAFALAYATWRWIELPIRAGQFRKHKALIATGALAASGVAGLAVMVAEGMPARFPPEIASLGVDLRMEANIAARLGTCLIDTGQTDDQFASECDGQAASNAARVALWGDSFAASLYLGMANLQRDGAGPAPAQYTIAGCPPVIDFTSKRNCASQNAAALARITTLKPRTVILSARWDLYDGRDGWGSIEQTAFSATVAKLREAGVQQVVVVGQFPVWTGSVPKILARHYLTDDKTNVARRDRNYLKQTIFSADEKIRILTLAAGAEFVSPLATQCDADGCLLSVPDSQGVPTAWDDGHLTVVGSAYFARVNATALFGR